MGDLDVVKSLAVRAGAILLAHFGRLEANKEESPNPTTDADRSASAFIVRELRRLFPSDGILSEEEPDDAERLAKSRIWIVDPLDGTLEFIHGVDEFAVMIGLAVDGMAELGVIYQPRIEKLYYATRGSGAFVTEDRETRLLRVSPNSDPATMTIAVSRSHPSPEVDAVRERLGIPHLMMMGSLGLKVGQICEGRAHLYLNTGGHTAQWDTCAPDILLHEAGGRMTDLTNAPLRYDRREVHNWMGVAASNGTIHSRVLNVVKAVLQRKRPQ